VVPIFLAQNGIGPPMSASRRRFRMGDQPLITNPGPAMTTTTATPPDKPDAPGRLLYLRVLTLAFTTFSTLRTLAYLPNMLSIIESGRSDQHSLLTWLALAASNATMAMWVYEHNGRRYDRIVVVNAVNTLMCVLTVAVIAAYR
jgi:hypothetical protein